MTIELVELKDSVYRVLQNIELPADEDLTWQQIIELGWLLVNVSEELGGLDAGLSGMVTMHQELGRKLTGAAYLPATLAMSAVVKSNLDDRDVWIERLYSGELISCSLTSSEVKCDNGVLSGSISAVPSADKSNFIMTWSEELKSILFIATDQSGVELSQLSTWDTSRRFFNVSLDQVALSEQIVVAEGEMATDVIKELLRQRDLAIAAESIGAASTILEMTVEHLQDRVQFKRPLAMFQALKHRCADMKANIEAAQALLFSISKKLDLEGFSASHDLDCKGAKLYAAKVFFEVAEDCLQLHGGIGMAVEHPCHLFLKRSLLNQQLCGSENEYSLQIADSLI